MANIQKTVALVVGIVLSLTGFVGFFSGSSLLGFGINGLHNVVHLATGLLGVFVGLYALGKFSRSYNKWLGVTYLLVTVLGFAGLLGFLNVNFADNILHVALGVVLAGVGFGMKEAVAAATPTK